MGGLTGCGFEAENVVVVLNKCDFFQKEKLERYEARLRSLVNIPKVIKEAPLIRTGQLLITSHVQPLQSQFLSTVPLTSTSKFWS